MILAIVLCVVFCVLFTVCALDADIPGVTVTCFFSFGGSVFVFTWLGVDGAVSVTTGWMLLTVVTGIVLKKQ